MALGEFGSKLMMTESTQDNSQVISMLSFRLRINKDIINEDKNKLIEIFPEYPIHEINKESRSVRQTERHNEPLKRTITSAESGKRYAILRDSQLMKTRGEVKLRKDLSTTQ